MHRNEMVGPSYRDMDASLFKNFTITEKVTGQFRAEVFNLANTPEFTNPSGNLDSCVAPGATCSATRTAASPDKGNFGQVDGVRQNSQRVMQLAARITF
jgi:hypothetical protein